MMGAEICPNIFWITKFRPWRKACAQTLRKEEQAILLLKLCAAFQGISYAKCKIKSIFQKQTGNFRALVTELRKSQLFVQSLDVTSLKSARGTATVALPVVLVKLPSDRCLSCKPTTAAGNLVGDLFADIHKAVFVVLVKGAIKYKGEELILVKEPKNELAWKANYLHFSICGLSSSGWGHVGRMNKQSLLLQLVLSVWRKNCFLGLAA